MNDPNTGSVPDLMVEKLALGELDTGKAKAVRAALEAAGDDRLAKIEASNAEILAELPPREVAAEVDRRVGRLVAREEPKSRALPWATAFAMAAAVVLLWIVMRGPEDDSESPRRQAAADSESAAGEPGQPLKIARADEPKDEIRFKGGTQLQVFRASSQGPEALTSGTKVAAGDRLQLSYASDAHYGVIVSIDGAGVATLHYPETEGGSTSLRGRAQLPSSYELDDAPGFERFFFVTSERELDVSAVMAAARALAAGDAARTGELSIPADAGQQSLLLPK